jgi:hypothetical protein
MQRGLSANHKECENKKNKKPRPRPPKQSHTHEYLGSVKIAEKKKYPHNHRFAGVTGQAIILPDGNHFHKLEGNTDFYENHLHKVVDITGPGIDVGHGRHVHFSCGQTTVSAKHKHDFQFATLIDNPIGEQKNKLKK